MKIEDLKLGDRVKVDTGHDAEDALDSIGAPKECAGMIGTFDDCKSTGLNYVDAVLGTPAMISVIFDQEVNGDYNWWIPITIVTKV